jgi:hypothetical protein
MRNVKGYEAEPWHGNEVKLVKPGAKPIQRSSVLTVKELLISAPGQTQNRLFITALNLAE